MKDLLPSALAVSIGLTIGNFVYQFMTGAPQWDVAVERSFFQFAAIALLVVLMWWLSGRQ